MAKRISRKADAEKMFVTAEAFLALRAAAQKTVADGNPTILELTMGTITAFALETNLKCLRMLECGEFLSGHDLELLFNDLPSKVRSEIEARHAAYSTCHKSFKGIKKAGLPTDLRSLLSRGKNSFDAYRYAYEGASGNGVLALDVFMLIIKDLILERRPDWDHLQLNRKRLPRIT